jgi:membrane-bound lytic murein transglycosylase B
MSGGARRVMGCGLGVVLAIVMVISLIGWALSFLDISSPTRQLQPVPDNVPPAGAAEVPLIDVHAPGRTSDKLDFWAAPLAEKTGIPAAAIRAYGNAELIARDAWPTCHIRWNTLAGIGWVESRHGTYSGSYFNRSHINEAGFAEPKIIGIPLDGSPGFAAIPDTDGGLLDGDTEWDRAVGPMQFIPESWKRYGRDANGDGVADPHQIDDAALGAAHLLCTNGGDLSTPEGWSRAIYAYNRSEAYLIDVRDAAASYALNQPAR